jgi:hypothetical protein
MIKTVDRVRHHPNLPTVDKARGDHCRIRDRCHRCGGELPRCAGGRASHRHGCSGHPIGGICEDAAPLLPM